MPRVVIAIACALALAACSSLAPPQSARDRVAYGAAPLDSVAEAAIAQYPYMPRPQVKQVHARIEQARAVREQMIAALAAGQRGVAVTRLQRMATLLAAIQSTLDEADHE